MIGNVRCCMSTPRNVTRSVAKGSVLSPLLFSIALASLPGSFIQLTEVMVHFALYADHLALWCVDPTTRGSAVRAALQQDIDWTVLYLNKIVLTMSPSKTA